MAAQAPTHLQLAVQYGIPKDAVPVDSAQLRRWVRAALEGDACFTLRFVDEEEGRALNGGFRGRAKPTNVLTFEYGHDPQQGHCADIVICMPVVVQEAQAQAKRVRDHLAHLVIHGVLHAQGYDHEDDASAAVMEALETTLLKRFRIDDPYR